MPRYRERPGRRREPGSGRLSAAVGARPATATPTRSLPGAGEAGAGAGAGASALSPQPSGRLWERGGGFGTG